MTSLALHGLAFIAAGENKVTSVKEMASAIGASEAHLSKVFQRLAKAGLVQSGRGPKGGFSLSRPAASISLYDIFEVMEGSDAQGDCPVHRPVCPFTKCLFGGILGKLEQEFRTYMSGQTLADFLDSPGQ